MSSSREESSGSGSMRMDAGSSFNPRVREVTTRTRRSVASRSHVHRRARAVRVASIPTAEFRLVLLRHPQVAVALVMDVVARLRRTLQATKTLTMDDVYGRAVKLLRAHRGVERCACRRAPDAPGDRSTGRRHARNGGPDPARPRERRLHRNGPRAYHDLAQAAKALVATPSGDRCAFRSRPGSHRRGEIVPLLPRRRPRMLLDRARAESWCQ